MKKLILIAVLSIIFFACDHKSKDKVMAMQFEPPAVKADVELKPNYAVAEKNAAVSDDKRVADGYENAGQNDPVKDVSKKIVKEGDISFETKNVNATRRNILKALKKLDGYVDEDNQSLNNEVNRKEYTLRISVPAANFDLLLDSVNATADKIDSKNIHITDVTTRFIDISTRLANKKILENRYLDLLKKSSKVADLLQIEDKLAEIREDIESTQGQLNYLKKQIAYSSLSITFYTDQITVEDKGEGFGAKLKDALTDSFEMVQKIFFGLIGLWPLWIVVLIIYVSIKRWRKRSVKPAN